LAKVFYSYYDSIYAKNEDLLCWVMEGGFSRGEVVSFYRED
jgi:hypothetical protein